MALRVGIRVLVIAVFGAPISSAAADIVLTPPAGGGVSVTNAAGNATRFRVGDDGSVAIPGGSLSLVNSTATLGNIVKGASRFIHNTGLDNTFIGVDAGNFAVTGFSNTGCGYLALSSIAGGDGNTASGAYALGLNADGNGNTANGAYALYANTGNYNTASGSEALSQNTSGSNNTASGRQVLFNNTSGHNNTAIGHQALFANGVGFYNTAIGSSALRLNSTNYGNTAVGFEALTSNTTGGGNTAVGYLALSQNATGTANIAIGDQAGVQTTGNYNISIGHPGVAGNGTIRIGNPVQQTRAFIAGIRSVTTVNANAVAVLIDSAGQLGTVNSSRRVKDDIADMGEASSGLMKLRPVSFRYKQHASGGPLQFGLIAEEVAEVYPGLVAHLADGGAETVMYHALPTMLLNEVQKQQRTIEHQATEIAGLKAKLDRLILALER